MENKDNQIDNNTIKSPPLFRGFNCGKIKKITKEKYLVLLILFSTVVVISFSVYYFVTNQQLNWQSFITHQPGPKDYRLLDGKSVASEKIALKPIVVMLENHTESRPTAGLEYASIIYETIVEGDITRFLAVFDGEISAKKIGPVRSVRPFFIEIAEEWDGVLFHAGGSKDAIYKLTYSSVYNVNEISGDGIYFWRDNNREMPHNLFTSADQIKRAIEAKNIKTEADFSPWLFKKDQPAGESGSINNIEIDFSGNPLYQVKYEYNQENNNYARYLAGKVHKTDRGIILKTKNIVLQYVDYDIIDSYGRLDINLTSGGKAEIYQDGRMIKGYWQKSKNRTRFYNQDNEEIRFNRGTIWVELLFR